MDDRVHVTDSSDDSFGGETWIEWFCDRPGNEFLCEVDRRYVEDQFNLFGLRETVNHFKACLDIILDRAEVDEFNPSLNLQRSVQDLYGLIHARFVLTKRGQEKMYRKFKEATFGVCPLLVCEAQPVLPVGLKDEVGEHNVLVFCPRCRQVMIPSVMAASRFEEIELDGAYFGSTFPHLFFMQHPHLLPPPPLRMEPYVPKVFGFRVRFPTEEERVRAVAENEALYSGETDEQGSGGEMIMRPVVSPSAYAAARAAAAVRNHSAGSSSSYPMGIAPLGSGLTLPATQASSSPSGNR